MGVQFLDERLVGIAAATLLVIGVTAAVTIDSTGSTGRASAVTPIGADGGAESPFSGFGPDGSAGTGSASSSGGVLGTGGTSGSVGSQTSGGDSSTAGGTAAASPDQELLGGLLGGLVGDGQVLDPTQLTTLDPVGTLGEVTGTVGGVVESVTGSVQLPSGAASLVALLGRDGATTLVTGLSQPDLVAIGAALGGVGPNGFDELTALVDTLDGADLAAVGNLLASLDPASAAVVSGDISKLLGGLLGGLLGQPDPVVVALDTLLGSDDLRLVGDVLATAPGSSVAAIGRVLQRLQTSEVVPFSEILSVATSQVTTLATTLGALTAADVTALTTS